MTSKQAAQTMIRALVELDVPHMLVDSFSTNAYGFPRSTKDCDIVVQLDTHSIQEIVDRLPKNFVLDPQIAFETVTGTTRYDIDVLPTNFGIELFELTDDAHDQSRFARRCEVLSPDMEAVVYLPTAEDVIVTKGRWGARAHRSKDLRDLKEVMAVQQNNLDWDYIHHWADLHGSRQLLDKIRASIPRLD